MRICVITDNKNSYSSKKFTREALFSKHDIFFASWHDISYDNGFILKKTVPLKKFDTIILRSSKNSPIPQDLIFEYCELHGLRLLNGAFYFRYQTVNKLRQQLLFQENKIPCLKTAYGEKHSYASLVPKLGTPFVAKLANGSLGKQVWKISSPQEFTRFIKERKMDKRRYLFQKFYQTDGDYRVFVIGKEIFGPVKRLAPKGEWRTNLPGAKHERAENKKKVLEIARKFADKTGIEFAGLDILIDSSGRPRLIEINTMPSFKVFDQIYPEVNIAQKTLELLTQK